eukprot:8396872-Pyramimonas_sp.AAC.1
MMKLRLLLSLYRGGGVIHVCGVVWAPALASQGILAGRGFATTLLRVMLMDPLDLARELYWSAAMFNVVDDITAQPSGSK